MKTMFDTLAKGGRVLYRGRTFAAVGKPVRIGAAAPRQLGSIEWESPSKSATIFVGRAKGKNPESQAGRCAVAPETASIQSIDRWFTMVRAAQVGREAVGATRLEASGWYKGAPEESVSYQVFPDENETDEHADARRRPRRALLPGLDHREPQDVRREGV